MKNSALIIVDVQNDFLPGGSLAVPEGDEIVPIINELLRQFPSGTVVSTKDSHPADHGSFASAHGAEPFTMGELNGRPQMMWPDHCVAETNGWFMAEGLNKNAMMYVVLKGENSQFDSYSGFKDDGGEATSLEDVLKGLGIRKGDTLYMCGLATDYCVKATALDGKALGFNVRVIIDACRGVATHTTHYAIDEMVKAGIEFVESHDLAKVVLPKI